MIYLITADSDQYWSIQEGILRDQKFIPNQYLNLPTFTRISDLQNVQILFEKGVCKPN